jgi:hypothetical protein
MANLPAGQMRRHYSTTEHLLLGAIKEQQIPTAVSRRSTDRAARRQQSDGPQTAAVRQASPATEVQPRRRKATQAQKQAVEDLDRFDPSASSKAPGRKSSLSLPALVPPPRSRSVVDDDKKLRVGIQTGYVPDRFRSQSVDIGALDPRQTTMTWAAPQPTTLLGHRTDLRTMCANETRKFDHHKRRSTTNVKRIALDAETSSLYDPEAPSRLDGAGQAPAWNRRTGYGSIRDLDDEASRAQIPKELREIIAKWSTMYRTAKGLNGQAGTGGKKNGGLTALSDLELFERKVSGMQMDTTSRLASKAALANGGDLPMVDHNASKAWPSKSVSMHDALKGKGTKPTPVIKLGRGNGHGPKRQKNFGAKKVLRPIAQEDHLFAYARAAWGRHHHYLLHDRATQHMREQSSPRSAAIHTALQTQ